jgi:alpha-1,3-mannosyltransferase
VSRQYHPGIGGIEEFVRQLAVRQHAAGHDVRVVTLDRIFDDPSHTQLPASESIDGIQVDRMKWFGSKRYPAAFKAPGLLGDADVVHVHGVDFLSDWLAATHPIHRKPMVLSTHGGFFHTPFAANAKRVFYQTITRLALTRYAAVVPSSVSDAETFGRIRKHGMVTIENAVDVEKFRGLADPTAKSIIYFGRLAPNKRVDLLISWFASLRKIDPDWRLTIAGKPMGVSIPDLVAQAESLGLGDSVRIVESPANSTLRELIGESGVYACASDYEGFGLAAVEGISAGLYPLLSDIAAFRRTVERVGFGCVIDFADPGAPSVFLAAWREKAMIPAPQLEKMLDRSYGWAAATDAFLDLYGKIMSSPRPRQSSGPDPK